MANIKSNLDKMLKWLYESKVLERQQILSNKEFDEPMKYMNILKKDQYVTRTWVPREYDRYTITGLGEKFFEEGGYGAETVYSEKVLKIAKDSRDLAFWALAFTGFSILLTLILWIVGRGK